MENRSDTTELLTGASKEDSFKIFNMIVNFVVLFVGVPGNFLIIRVYMYKTIKKSTYVLIMGLAWADLFVCILSVTAIVWQSLKLARIETSSWFRFLLMIRTIIVTSSVLLTGVIAADRYDCVCRPQKRFFNLRRAKGFAWASFMFAIIWNLPLIIGLYFNNSVIRDYILPIAQIICYLSSLLTITFCYGKVYTVIQKHVRASQSLGGASIPTGSFKRCESTTSGIGKDNCADSSDNGVSHSHHHQAVKLNTPRAIDSSSLGPQPERSAHKCPTSHEFDSGSQPVTTSSGTGADKGTSKSKLDLLLRSRSLSGHSVALQRKTTRMLFITSLVFLLTWLPYWILNAVSLAHSSGSNASPEVLEVMEDISLTLLLNNAVNPFIYGIANRRFRKDFRQELRKIKPC